MIQCSKCSEAKKPGSGFCARCGNSAAGRLRLSPANKKNLTIILIVTGVFVLACSKDPNAFNTSRPPAPATPTPEPFKPWVDIPALANKSPEEFDKAFGKAATVTPITKTPEEMPGEFRHYKVTGLEETLQVRFYKGKAVSFNVTLTKAEQKKTAEELVKYAGFNTEGKRAERPSAYVAKWSGEFGGVQFVEITAVKSNVDDYYTLSAKVQ